MLRCSLTPESLCLSSSLPLFLCLPLSREKRTLVVSLFHRREAKLYLIFYGIRHAIYTYEKRTRRGREMRIGREAPRREMKGAYKGSLCYIYSDRNGVHKLSFFLLSCRFFVATFSRYRTQALLLCILMYIDSYPSFERHVQRDYAATLQCEQSPSLDRVSQPFRKDFFSLGNVSEALET